jgi:hypothetical protein
MMIYPSRVRGEMKVSVDDGRSNVGGKRGEESEEREERDRREGREG